MSSTLSNLIRSAFVVVVTLAASAASADEPLVLDRGTAHAPLESLKKRSGLARWQQIKNGMQTPPRTAARETVSQPQDAPKPIPPTVLRTRRPEPILYRPPVDLPNVIQEGDQQTIPAPPVIDKPGTVELFDPTATPDPLRIAAQPLGQGNDTEPVRSPSQLKKITEILPYFDYEPDPDAADDDICRNLCPRPDGKPCKVYPEGANVPQCPEQFALSSDEYPGRMYSEMFFLWSATDLYHNPLYFSDIPLERYGHTYNDLIQPFASIARFGVQVLGMPYQMTIDPPDTKRYSLGLFRPGECAPYLFYQVPWNTEAAVVEAGVVTGLFYAIP